jgi:pyridoxine kinase
MTKTILSIQSHVAFGYVGNRAAVFPLQRLGFDVIAINTVQFSNHTGYGAWSGEVFPAEHIQSILEGVYERCPKIDALLTGYLGSADIGKVIINATDRFKIKTWLCDPVMGDVGRGFFVNKTIPDFFRNKALKYARIMTPNQFELNALTGIEINHINDAITACESLHLRGVEIVLVTSLETQAQPENEISMLASHKSGEAYIITTPKFDMNPAPNGSGDMTAALFLGHIMQERSMEQALSLTAASVYEVFEKTAKLGQRELAIIEAQDSFINPANNYSAQKL